MARARYFWTGLVAGLALICGSLPAEAWAQRGSSSGGRNTSSGTFGGRSLGAGTSGGNRSFGGSNRGGGGGRGGQGGISQLGGGGGGRGVQGRTTDSSAGIGALDGNERFSRGRQPGQFVGSDANDTTNFMSAMALGSALSGRGGRGGRGGRNRNNANNNRNNRGDSRPALPVRRVVAFDVPSTNTSAASEILSGRLNRSLRSANQQIAVSFQGRTAVLTGVVATAHDRDLAARLALLEPGVDAVDNSLRVGESLPAPD